MNMKIYLDGRDTVSSLGVVRRRSLPVTTTTSTRTFRHAISLDERRANFQATLWEEKELHLTNHGNAGTHKARTESETDVEEVWFAVCAYIDLKILTVALTLFVLLLGMSLWFVYFHLISIDLPSNILPL